MPDDPPEPETDTDYVPKSSPSRSDEIFDALVAARDEKDAKRGEWTVLWAVEEPRYVGALRGDPQIAGLLWKYEEHLKFGIMLREAAEELAHSAWREGAIDGYDLGQADARKELGKHALNSATAAVDVDPPVRHETPPLTEGHGRGE